MAAQHLIDPSTLAAEALAPRGATDACELHEGIVSAQLGAEFIVTHGGGSSLASRAASCLLAPQPRDTVLVARVAARAFVLAVLEREGEARAIEVDGDLTLRSRGGAVHVEAQSALRLRSRGALSAAGHTMTLAAERASLVAEHVQLFAEHLSVEATRMREVAHFAERSIESVKETLGRSYRQIRDGEHVQAGSLTLSLSGLLRAHAETAIVTAKKLVKMNADQIHLG